MGIRDWAEDHPILVLLGGLITCLVVLWAISRESPEAARETYQVWCRVHKRPDVTFSDWQYLRSKHMLPGQDTGAWEKAEQAESAAAVATGVAIGLSASSSGR